MPLSLIDRPGFAAREGGLPFDKDFLLEMAGIDSDTAELSTEAELAMVAEPELSEVLVFDGRLYNDRLGTAFEYRVKVAVKVLDNNKSWVEEKASRFQNELNMELDTIWRSADPRHLREVDKRTLSGRIHRMLEQWLEAPENGDQEGNEQVVKDVVVVPSPGIRINR